MDRDRIGNLDAKAFHQREIEILDLMAQGWSNQAIADKLFLSIETIKWYSHQIYSKLGAENRTQAIARAAHAGILETSYPSTAISSGARHNIPAPLTSYIGRQKDLETLPGLILSPATRLVTIVGGGGMGKTRLALKIAHVLVPEFANGVWLVDLSSVNDPGLVAQAVVNSLGWRNPQQITTEVFLVQRLQLKPVLLIWDNCEHLAVACAYLATQLLKNCPNLRILATSRQAFGVAGETTYPIAGLTFPDPDHLPDVEALQQYSAVQLFGDRVRRVLPGFSINQENALAVAQICRRLDGVPLALELVAVHANQLSLSQIASLVDNHLWELTTSPGVQFSRHSSLQACVEWSFNLLTESERILLRRLAVFSGGWTLEAAESVTGLQLDILNQLFQKSMVVSDTLNQDQPRYRFHEIIRQYALEKLNQSDEATHLSERHLAYYLDFMTRMVPRLNSSGRLIEIQRCTLELDNFRKALSFAYDQPDREMVAAGLRLATLLKDIWFQRGLYPEGNGWIRKGMELAGDGLKTNTALYAAALGARGLTAIYMGHPTESPLSTAYMEESIRQYRLCQDKDGLLVTLLDLGSIVIHMDFSQAKSIFDESLALARLSPNGWMMAQALFWRGHFALKTGDLVLAENYFQHSLAYWHKTGDITSACYPTITLSMLACERDDPELARNYLDKYLLLSRDTPEKMLYLFACDYVALVAHYLGDFALLETYFQDKIEFFANLGLDFVAVIAMRMLGLAAKRRQDYYRAVAYYLEAFEFAHHRQDMDCIAISLAGLGGVAAWSGQTICAAHLLGAAQAALEKLGKTTFQDETIQTHHHPAEQIEFERDLAHLQEQLNPDDFTTAWNKGRAMSPERAILEAYKIKPVRTTKEQPA